MGAGVVRLDDAQRELGHLFGRKEPLRAQHQVRKGVNQLSVGEREERAGIAQIVYDARLGKEVERGAELALEPARALREATHSAVFQREECHELG